MQTSYPLPWGSTRERVRAEEVVYFAGISSNSYAIVKCQETNFIEVRLRTFYSFGKAWGKVFFIVVTGWGPGLTYYGV